MSCGVHNEWRTNQEVETVTAAFAFIYDEPISGASSPVPADECRQDVDECRQDVENVDVVVDEHFSFLNKLHDSDGPPDSGEPIYANVRSPGRSAVTDDRSVRGTTKLHKLVDHLPAASQKLDIRISNTGTNIQHGNTVINIPCESESACGLAVRTEQPDCGPPIRNSVAVYLDDPSDPSAGMRNGCEENVIRNENPGNASQCRRIDIPDNPQQNPQNRIDSPNHSGVRYDKEIELEADMVIKRLTTDSTEDELSPKRFCRDYRCDSGDESSSRPIRDQSSSQADIEMDAFNAAIYVAPSVIRVRHSIAAANGPLTAAANGPLTARGVSADTVMQVTCGREGDDCDVEMWSSGELAVKYSEACDIDADSSADIVTLDGTLHRDDENIRRDCPTDSESRVDDFVEAWNDDILEELKLHSESVPVTETVSKGVTASAASHLEILLHLDKEVESIDPQPSDAGGLEGDQSHDDSDTTIRLSCKSTIAEALNPSILFNDTNIPLEGEAPPSEIVSWHEQQLGGPSSLDSSISHPPDGVADVVPDESVQQPCTAAVRSNEQETRDKGSSLTDSPKITLVEDDLLQENVGFAASVGRAIRLSMRRMRQIRLSGRRSKRTSSEAYAYYNEGVVSEETEVRRGVPPDAPAVGLASVRSPAASAVLMPSILAALAPSTSSTEEVSVSDATEGASDSLSSQSAESSDGRTYNRSDSDSGPQNDLARSDRSEDAALRRDPSSSPPPGYSVAIQGSSSHTSAPRSASDAAERLAQHEPLVEPCQPARVQQPRSSRGRTRHASPDQVIPPQHGRNPSGSLSRDTLVRTDATPVSTVSGRSSQPARRSVSNSSVDTTSDPSLLNERRRQSRRSSPSRQSSHASSNISGFMPPKRELWPHSFSGVLASLPLTLNVFNISRFALFGAKYGWQFPIQWGIVSLVFGLPLMVFHMAVGQLVGAGPIDMWVISPIFQGVGYGVLIAEALLGVYCCIPIAWLFTYFRESFDMGTFRCITSYDCENPHNLSAEINQVVPQFFVSNILARSQSHGVPLANLGTIHFNLAFNLLIIWIILFVALSRGAKTLGKICYLSTLLPFICFNVVCCYLIYIAFTQLPVVSFFPKFLDKQSWMAAAREAFLVWALHGAALQQLSAGNRKGHPLWRDTTIIALLTGSGLFLASFCGIVCSTVLHEKTLRFSPSSFETAETRQMTAVRNWVSKSDMTYGTHKASHIYDMFTPQDVYDNFYVGIRIRKQFLESDTEPIGIRSGYNSIRFLTEMFPALLFTLRSPIEATIPPLFYLSLLMFGLAHQISVWYCVIQGVIRMQYGRLRAIETFLTFCCCVFGFSAALPLATGAGMNVLYFLDFIVGSAWWLMILQLIYIFGILLVRGKPFSASDLANELFGGKGRMCGLKHSLALCWTVLIPVGLVVATISSFQAGDYRQVFTWECSDWPVWVCQLASALQLFPLVLVPLFGIVKTCIFLSHPRHNFLQKLEFLYRPPPFRDIYQEDDQFLNEDADDSLDLFRGELISQANRRRNQSALNDPPPKYTPPPSYSTATGSSLAKSLENTVRRSFRYLRRHPSRATHSQLPP